LKRCHSVASGNSESAEREQQIDDPALNTGTHVLTRAAARCFFEPPNLELRVEGHH